jgi:hypothetical protein
MLVYLAGTSKHRGWVDEAIGTSECVNDDQFVSDLTSVYRCSCAANWSDNNSPPNNITAMISFRVTMMGFIDTSPD